MWYSIVAASLLHTPAFAGAEKTLHGAWTHTYVSSLGHMASTDAISGRDGMRMAVGCEEGVFSVRFLNVALIMTRQTGYKTEFSYDGNSWTEIANDTLPADDLLKLFESQQVHVRWHIKEGLVSETFSLDGARVAISPVATECSVVLPTTPAVVPGN